MIEAFNLKQHISEPTHKSGHTLDLIITRADEDVARNFKVYDPVISDHLAVGCTLSIPKKAFEKKEVSYRKIKSVDMGQLREDIKNSCLVDPVSVGGDLDALTRKYNTVLSELLDKHAPLKKRTITLRPSLRGTIIQSDMKNKDDGNLSAVGGHPGSLRIANCTLINVIWSISAFLMLRWTITPRL